MNNFVQINKLCKKYNTSQVVDNVSLSLDKGEILCLLGPSGSGKTTFLRLIAGLESADSGIFFFNGGDMAGVAPHKRNFGMMFQEYALFPHKNVYDNISFGLEMAGWSKAAKGQRVREMETLVGLGGKSDRKIVDLSGGEQQRVALARSLAPQPRLLLLDEPLGSLDRTMRDRLAGEIRSILKKQETTAIFVTHDQSEAFRVADRIGILMQGRMIQFDEPEQIYRKPINEAVARFLGFNNLIDCKKKHSLQVIFQKIPPGLSKYQGRLLIRPEGAVLDRGGKESAGSQLCIEGIVVERLFQGYSYELKILCGSQHLHFVLAIDPEPPEIEEVVKLVINPASLVKVGGDFPVQWGCAGQVPREIKSA
jgi:ABC-type Fe3+/spermidine/putrescine transport system ATPase subunit